MEGQGSPLSTDRLPLGKQEVVVSVDVQSPANLNFDQPATVKIIVRNGGSTDALGVVVRDELPPGTGLRRQPARGPAGGRLAPELADQHLPAGSDRVILLKVKPTKVGAFDHAATVYVPGRAARRPAGCSGPGSRWRSCRIPTDGKVLKNKTAEFRIAVTNTGDGPARNVIVQAKLSPGLRHDSGERNEDNSFELPIQQISPGQREELDPLTVDATSGRATVVPGQGHQHRRRLRQGRGRGHADDRSRRAQAQAHPRGPGQAIHRHGRPVHDHAGDTSAPRRPGTSG